MQQIGFAHKIIELLEIAAQPMSADNEPLVPVELNAEQRSLAKRMMARLREIGEAQKIAPALMANRSVIERMVHGERDLPLLKGWRADVVGNSLLGMLEE